MRRAPWAALLTSLLCGAAAARQPAEPATLGRLFSTPQERSVLDARRSGGPDQPAGPDMGAGAIPGLPGQGAIGAADGPPGAPAAAVKAPAAVLDGIVRRSSGGGTAWVNQEAQSLAIDPQRKDKAGRGAVVRSDRGVLTLKLASGKRVPLKPGQRYDLGDGSVKEDSEP